jgi:hypothetical protein
VDAKKVTSEVTKHLGTVAPPRRSLNGALPCSRWLRLRLWLAAGVTVKPYDEIFADLAAIDKTLPSIKEPPTAAAAAAAAGDSKETKTAAAAAAPAKVCNKIWMDGNKANMALFNSVTDKVRCWVDLAIVMVRRSLVLTRRFVLQYILDKDSPIALLKAVKNEVQP